MPLVPLRLRPGTDLRRALESAAAEQGVAAFVVAGIGSLVGARLRLAGRPQESFVTGPLEILSLAGSLSADGPHLHMAVAGADGRVTGGHVGYGCEVRTTAEVLLAPLADWELGRELDPATGYAELVVRQRSRP